MTDYYKDIEYEYKPRVKYAPKFTSEEVYSLRNDREISLHEAKSILMKEQILKDLTVGRNCHNVVLLYDILEYLIEEML